MIATPSNEAKTKITIFKEFILSLEFVIWFCCSVDISTALSNYETGAKPIKFGVKLPKFEFA